MNHVAEGAGVRLRAGALWMAVTATAAALGALALPDATALATAPGPDFAALLVQLCAAAALVALAALWLITTDVVRQVLVPGGPGHSGGSGRPGPLRTLLLTACGVAVLSSTTAIPAFAMDEPDAPLTAEVLQGLPLPDRSTGAAPAPAAIPHTADHRADEHSDRTDVRVRPGDSLWTIAARALGPTASNADLAAYWRRIHAANTAVIGPDPDLIQPDQRLHLPRP